MQNLYFKQGTRADLPAVLRLQKLCYQSEAALYNDYTIQPLTQTIEELYRDFDNGEKCRIALLNDELIFFFINELTFRKQGIRKFFSMG